MAGREDRASRSIAAPASKIFAALTDPGALEVWLPPSGMTCRVTHYDAVLGGQLCLTLTFVESGGGQGKSTPDSDEVCSDVVELVPDRRIGWRSVFVSDDPAFAGAMTMTWNLRPDVGGTRVDIVASDVPPGIDDSDHALGMASSLAQLAKFVTG
ncbi:ATPase [Gordonia sp. TBRC 11910]|uniref:ATPase n=1 Tax=Gordonia asplenii TaxID=2725283 RepID=A0A848KX44_9ACTN|nr:SRPBCC domain-containing protein [Gordonia asplenii]NMO03364.1 ATPase [Gordonia asplenii]